MNINTANFNQDGSPTQLISQLRKLWEAGEEGERETSTGAVLEMRERSTGLLFEKMLVYLGLKSSAVVS